MGRHGINAVKAPVRVGPYPIAAVSRRLPRVQLRESIPWLYVISLKGNIISWARARLRLTQKAHPIRLMCQFSAPVCHRHYPLLNT